MLRVVKSRRNPGSQHEANQDAVHLSDGVLESTSSEPDYWEQDGKNLPVPPPAPLHNQAASEEYHSSVHIPGKTGQSGASSGHSVCQAGQDCKGRMPQRASVYTELSSDNIIEAHTGS